MRHDNQCEQWECEKTIPNDKCGYIDGLKACPSCVEARRDLDKKRS